MFLKKGRSVMKRYIRWLPVPLLIGILLGPIAAREDSPPTISDRPELEYLKAVNRAGPPRDPQLLFLLMGQYMNANRHRDGIEFFSSLVKQFEPRLSDGQKSLYLGAIGLLRPDRRAMYHFLAGSAGSKKPSRLWNKPSGYQEARFLLSDGYREWSMLSFPASSIRGKLRSLTLGGA